MKRLYKTGEIYSLLKELKRVTEAVWKRKTRTLELSLCADVRKQELSRLAPALVDLVVNSQLRTLAEALAAAFVLAEKGLFIGVNVHVFSQVLLAGKALRAVVALKVAHVQVLGVDMSLQVEFGVVASRTVRVEAGKLVIIHLSLTLPRARMPQWCGQRPGPGV